MVTVKSVSPWYGHVITLAQGGADFLSAVLCFLFSYFLYVGPLSRSIPQTWIEFSLGALFAGALYLFLLERAGLYKREISLLNVKELRGIFWTGIYAALIILSVTFYLRSVVFSRIMMTTALGITPVLIYLQRQVFYRFHILFHQRGWSQQKLIIYGAGNIGTHLAKRLFESPSLGLLPIGFLDDDVSKHGQQVRWTGIGPKGGLPVLGGEEVMSRAKEMGASTLMIALPSADFSRNLALVDACKNLRLDYTVVPNSYGKFVRDVELFELGGIPMFRLRENTVSWVYLVIKRTLDFSLSLFFLLILSPFVLVAAFLIKTTSAGPVFFKQKRVGMNGRRFSIYKFRTMHIHAPAYARTPSDPSDPRITSVGRWLRRTSLDELPQLFNVLRGDMSIVGPRPEMPFIAENYTELQCRRLLAKPGITGVWQISAVRGEPIHENIEYDLFYLENRSVLLDVAIIIKTILSVIRGIGAV